MSIDQEEKKKYAFRMTQLMNEGRSQEAILNIARELSQHPADDALHYLLGNAYSRQSNWQKALEHYAEAIALNPKSPAQEAKTMLMNILDFRYTDLLNP